MLVFLATSVASKAVETNLEIESFLAVRQGHFIVITY